MTADERNELISTAVVIGFIMITVVAVVAGCLGGCYIVENTKREYIKRGYVEQWDPLQRCTKWVKAEETEDKVE